MLAKALLTVLIAGVTLTAAGQDKKYSIKHLKKTNPDVLYFSLYLDNKCPGTLEAYEEIVEGELLRARIAPQSGWRFYEIFLNTIINCTNPGGTSMAYDLDIHFAVFHPVLDPGPDEIEFNVLHYLDGYGSVGLRTHHSPQEVERVLRSFLKEYVSMALTDYLKANFTE